MLFTQKHIILIHVKHRVSIYVYLFFCTVSPTAVGKQRRGCLLKRLVETDYMIQETNISDSSQIFASCSCWRTRLFQTTHLFRPVFEVNVCGSVQPFYVHLDKRVLLLHEGHSSLNILGLRDPLTSILMCMCLS